MSPALEDQGKKTMNNVSMVHLSLPYTHTRTHSHTPFLCLTILPLPLYSHIFHPLFSNCLLSVFFPQLFVEKKKNFCCLLLNSLSVNTAGSSAFNGRPEGQALGSAEPEDLCVYQTVMVTVAFLIFPAGFHDLFAL